MIDWNEVKEALVDELDKISAISLSSLSSKAVLNAPQPQPIDTPAVTRAKQILDKTEVMKTAAPGKTRFEKAHDVMAPVIGGAALGNMMNNIVRVNPTRPQKLLAAGIGGSLALADSKYRDHLRKMRRLAAKPKTAAFLTPALSLKATRQVGGISEKLKKPQIKTIMGPTI